MPIDTSPQALAAAATCFSCIPKGLRPAVLTYLMAVKAGGSTDPQELARAAAAFNSLSEDQLRAVQTYLMSLMVTGGGFPGAGFPFTWTPANISPDIEMTYLLQVDSGIQTFEFPGATFDTSISLYTQESLTTVSFPNLTTTTTDSAFDLSQCSSVSSVTFPNLVSSSGYLSFNTLPALTAIAFPKLTTGGTSLSLANMGLTSVSLPLIQDVSGLEVGGMPDLAGTLSFPSLKTVSSYTSFNMNVLLEALSMPVLTAMGQMVIQSNSNLAVIDLPLMETLQTMNVYNNTLLEVLSFPALTAITSPFQVYQNPALTTVSFPLLTTCPAGFNISQNPLLTSIEIPLFVPANGDAFFMGENALPAAFINDFLAKCVANPAYVIGTIQFTGGTNEAPTGQGLVDRTTLQARGVVVQTN